MMLLHSLLIDRWNRDGQGVPACPYCGAAHQEARYVMGCPPDAPRAGVAPDGRAWTAVAYARCPTTGAVILVQAAR